MSVWNFDYTPLICPPVIIENPSNPWEEYLMLAYYGEGSLKTLIFILENIGRVLV